MTIANEIGIFFYRKVDLIRSGIDANTPMNVEDQNINNDTNYNRAKTLSDFSLGIIVRDIIEQSAKKSCELDAMPSSLVMSCLDEFLPVITRVVNSSHECGHFTSDWKEALLKLTLKGGHLTHEFANLRPASNLKFISKLTERAAIYILFSNRPAVKDTVLKQHC